MAIAPASVIHYPSRDGKPVAETYDHLYALLTTLEALKQYLQHERGTVLANQFLYYAQGYPRLRVAPDVMVIFGVEPGGRDNYKVWEEGHVPQVIFEFTSPSTRNEDTGFKYQLYEQLGVQEYWLFDPKAEWLTEQLQGYHLIHDLYRPVEPQAESGRFYSPRLKLFLRAEGKLLGFYNSVTGEKLLTPGELATELDAEVTRRLEAEARAEELARLLKRYQEKFGDLPENGHANG
ncbi:Uma2 family endonuclease [Candidatus Synechococcus calcipolaris G9]|uniref:Uma2 family endonuclease n=1 Tax=Candidatus Synechococcus calcipolaris G9 TaxID=1497997 RepID=A0ABT6EYJ3_9SYNE|nr:Uma2 family endonuclease [Candidatus Synechococcus calcipolaris]MDG2989960.1 Uma2 family endonuclease [Candidatus Synechococcus calcipolaris G9]